jgi:hypothetical protein
MAATSALVTNARSACVLACLVLALSVAGALVPLRSLAQNLYAPEPNDAETLGVSATELEAFEHADAGRHVRARELAERVVQRDPYSFVGHFVLGLVQHYGEANLPRRRPGGASAPRAAGA